MNFGKNAIFYQNPEISLKKKSPHRELRIQMERVTRIELA